MNIWNTGTLDPVPKVQEMHHHNEVKIMHMKVIVCFDELLLANLSCVSLNFLELSLKKKLQFLHFSSVKYYTKLMIRFVRDDKDIDSHLNYFTGTLVYVPLSNVSLNKALDFIDCYCMEKPRYCNIVRRPLVEFSCSGLLVLFQY